MADSEHVERLKQGVDGWNSWRAENTRMQPDLRGAFLNHADLNCAHLSGANLVDANLNYAHLSGTDLGNADLRAAHLRAAHLDNADLRGAYLNQADLSYADLRGANLSNADLSGVDLSYADLSDADLSDADLHNARLGRANLHGAKMWNTTIANTDLRETKGLSEIQHDGPSRVELYSIQLPQDGSALHFLRGAGVPDEWIDFWRSTMMHPIQYYSLFISYSSKDDTLAHRLHADLQAHGVRCWFAPEDMKIGGKIRQRIDEAIHLQDKLLLLLSEQSIASSWVENEVEAALEKEERQQREVLFPVRLDNMVMQTSKAWAATLRRTRHIGDFTAWMDPKAYQSAFDRLLRDLKQN